MRTHQTSLFVALVAAFCLVAGVTAAAPETDRGRDGRTGPAKTVTTPSGLQYIDHVVGAGATASNGNTVRIHYVGTLKDGTKFDSTHDRQRPFEFKLGAKRVIKGFDEGVLGMKVGGKRRVTIPPHLGYGKRARGKIPANAVLIFELELLAIL